MKFALIMVETVASRQHVKSDRAGHRAAIEKWIGQLAGQGVLLGGEAFETERVLPVTLRLNQEGGRDVIPGPFSGSSETLGGYFLVQVRDIDHAIDVARSWPTEETIEIRPIWVP